MAHPLSVDWVALDKRGQAHVLLQALRAWRNGEATPEQQQMAWDAVQHIFCAVDDVTWRNDQKLQDALEGRRTVALQLRRATQQSYATLSGKQRES